MVTARHVADQLVAGSFFVRLNKHDGTAGDLEFLKDTRWYVHPDETVDVAVLPLAPDPDVFTYKWISPTMIASDAWLAKWNIGPGDEVFITGLFADLRTSERNVPIVRMGNVAMLPSQRVRTGLGYADAYLIEARSIGGISGCPVFVRETVSFPHEYAGTGDDRASIYQVTLQAPGPFCLLGLMHGHWDLPPEMQNQYEKGGEHGVNMGIALVVPASKIREVLTLPELVEQRQRFDMATRAPSRATPRGEPPS